MTDSVVLLSGGMDSTTALAVALDDRHTVKVAVSVDYGQRHRRELDAAAAIAARYGIEHVVVQLAIPGGLAGSALTDPDVPVPHGHYADASMKATVVPNRNAIMANIAAGIAISRGADTIVLGVHAGDHPIYPDCRPAFVDALRALLEAANDPPVRVFAPFLHNTKTDIAGIGNVLRAPLDLTWSCYQGGDVHCGRCGTCVERREAFTEAGVTDPTVYADPTVAADHPANTTAA